MDCIIRLDFISFPCLGDIFFSVINENVLALLDRN